MELTQVMYNPSSDAMQRHNNYGVQKHRKSLSTGGGRAWSHSEEAYLLQTRQQKMPYKHIAAHLNKTELACRLHYHQISHGSSRRKRNLSCSNMTTDYTQMLSSHDCRLTPISPPDSVTPNSFAPSPHNVRLPSIALEAKLPAILPKPGSIPEAHAYSSYPEHQQRLPSMHSRPVQQQQQHHHQKLRLDTSVPVHPAPSHDAGHVDLARLQAVYNAKRAAFWASVAADYGHNSSPALLEQAWRTGQCCRGAPTSSITPGASPVGNDSGSLSSIMGSAMDERQLWDVQERRNC